MKDVVVIGMVWWGEREKVGMEGRWGARAYKGCVRVLLVSWKWLVRCTNIDTMKTWRSTRSLGKHEIIFQAAKEPHAAAKTATKITTPNTSLGSSELETISQDQNHSPDNFNPGDISATLLNHRKSYFSDSDPAGKRLSFDLESQYLPICCPGFIR